MLLARALRPLIRTGRLTVIDADGNRHVFGHEPEPAVTVRLHDRSLHWKLALNPGLHAGEAWMAGTLTVEEGKGLYDFLDLFGRNLGLMGLGSFKSPLRWLKPIKRRWHRLNDRVSSERNVAHHYDLSGEMYGLFLDSERQYTCAYHPTGTEDIETAQRLKERHIAAKLRLAPGMRVLDLGCGWGSLAMYLARHHDVDVTAVNLSKEQVAWGNERARELGLADRVRLLHKDYREVEGSYDRVVSIGMLEHVGVRQYETLFRRIKRLVAADGVALVHSIGRVAGPGTTNAWIRKYIFPGGYIPALSEVLPAIERSGLWVTDIEVLRLHYAYTLKGWRERFMANRQRAADLYDERFVRMWEYYLATSEISFRYLDNMNFQIQLCPDRNTLPLARDYMVAAERTQPCPRLVGRAAG
ncbi:MAG: class I SAM-dependent methyltransferase [Geminicoccaceae bacterium]